MKESPTETQAPATATTEVYAAVLSATFPSARSVLSVFSLKPEILEFKL